MASTIEHASVGGADVGGATAFLSSLAPTCRVRWRIVSTSGASPSGKNSSSSERARRYGSKAPILARVRSYSGVQRSGMISAAGVMVRRDAKQRRQPPTAHVLQRTLSPAALAVSPVAAMLLRLRLNQMALQPGQGFLAFRQRQPQRFRRMVDRGATADADFMGLDATVRSGQFHEDPPLHPALLVCRDQADL